MAKQPYETISTLLDKQDIEYLSNLLYTIETKPELRSALLPTHLDPSRKSNFNRVMFKLNTINLWYNPKVKLVAIEKPDKPLYYSRLKQNKPIKKKK